MEGRTPTSKTDTETNTITRSKASKEKTIIMRLMPKKHRPVDLLNTLLVAFVLASRTNSLPQADDLTDFYNFELENSLGK